MIEDQEISENWALYNADCVEGIKNIPDESIHYSIFSPPFASLFTYSDSDRDMGNCKGSDEFYKHFMFLIGDIYRVLKPGRLVSIHCMDLPATLNHDGFIGFKDFPGDIIWLFESEGFIYHSRVCIWKDPLVQATRTKQLQLAHKQISKDSSMCAQGLPDYIVTMRKPGKNQEPISHGRGFETYYGEKGEPKLQKTDDPRTNKFSHKIWQRYASPVWYDINQTDTLNVKMAREKDDERHICPLQLCTIARCLELWSALGDIVLSPFAGIGSEGFKSLQMGRKFIGFELKRSYYDCAVRNLREVENSPKQLDLFN